MVSKVILVRHGLTEGNVKGWVYGGVDIPLLEEGRKRVEAYRRAGLYPPVPDGCPVFTSQLQRTRQTLQAAYGDLPHTELAEFNEFHFGKYERRLFVDVKKDPEFQELWKRKDPDESIGGGESMNGFQQRVRAGWQKVLAAVGSQSDTEPEKRTGLVVIHGGPIAQIMLMLFPREKYDMWTWVPDPGLGYVLTIDGDKADFTRIGGAPGENAVPVHTEDLEQV